jgi:hypothetical protein
LPWFLVASSKPQFTAGLGYIEIRNSLLNAALYDRPETRKNGILERLRAGDFRRAGFATNAAEQRAPSVGTADQQTRSAKACGT